jgi:hypothetical protein
MSFLHPRRASADGLEDDKRGKAENIEDCSIITCIDHIQVLGLAPEDAEFYRNFDASKRKRLLWKACSYQSILNTITNREVLQVDIRLVPMLSVLYLVSHLDRANIGNAKIAGLTEDLGLSGIQYNIALSLFFIPYVLLGESNTRKFLSDDLWLNSCQRYPVTYCLRPLLDLPITWEF